ncbi:hypothetical protein [Geobacter sp.]|uniref:hypothetical protein n=1 Tax=Geobacter sp. TaxID=46610 RepID=UPI0027BAC0AF|nr:hypothetical protein [Geobacter sp.]
MAQFNPNLINRYIAPGIADFTNAVIPDLRPAFAQAEHWLSNHFLNSAFGVGFAGTWRQYAINMLSRAQAQFSLYHQARDATLIYLERSTLHNPALRHYFSAVFLWESCFLNLQIFIDLYAKSVGMNAFDAGDGSEEQRAYDIANAIKHWGGVIKAQKHDDNHTIPMWLSNTGFHTYAYSLTYGELAAITTELAKTADDLQHPASFKNPT